MPGRPKKRTETYGRISVELPTRIIAEIDALVSEDQSSRTIILEQAVTSLIKLKHATSRSSLKSQDERP